MIESELLSIPESDDSENQKDLSFSYNFSIQESKDLVLLFEKESSRYEESASVVYEKLIDKGYKNAYYIIDEGNVKLKDIKEKYKRNIIYKDSLKHIMYFFKCKKFVGTESLGHAMQLRIASRLVVNKLNKKEIPKVPTIETICVSVFHL